MVGPINSAGYAQYGLQNTFRPGEQTGENRQSQLAQPPSPEKNTGQNIGNTTPQQVVKETNPANSDLTRVSTTPDQVKSPLLTGTSSDRGNNLDISV